VIRRLLAGLIVVGLAVGIWALWPRAGSDPTPTTLPVAAETTTTTQPTTSTSAAATTSTSEDRHVVTTVEEAEEILRLLWFGWFEGIYNQDETRIREVVGTQAMLDAARAAFETVTFVEVPTPEGVDFFESETLFSSETCLVVWSRSDATFLAPGEPREGVDVLRWFDERWLLASTWAHREDLWEADCEAELESLS
jgi:hypothetical protein